MSQKRKNRPVAGQQGSEFGQVRISDQVVEVPIEDIRPSPENDELYRPVDPEDPDFLELVKSIRDFGIKEPLVISLDGFIISGHRRFAAAKIVGLETVPCRRAGISRIGPDGKVTSVFMRLLREFNRQRVKSLDEVIREEVLSLNPDDAHRELKKHRKKASRVK